MSRLLSVEEERIAVFYVWETGRERGLAVKRSRLSGAALAVAALVAAMVASAAYGITTAGVQGQMDFKSCVSGTGGDGCTAVDNALGQPTAMGLSADESRLFVVSHGTDAVSAFVRNRATGGLEPLKTNQIPCTTQAGGGGCADGHGLVGPVDVAAGGSTAYIVSDGSDALAVLTKDNQGGAWKQLNNDPGHSLFYCLAATTADGCQATSVPQTLVDPASVATGGSRVYVGGPGSIAVFSSGTKGALRQLTSGTNNQDGCVTDDGSGGDCADGDIPGTVVNMAISRDGKKSVCRHRFRQPAGVQEEQQRRAQPAADARCAQRVRPGRRRGRCGQRGDERLRRRQQRHRRLPARQEHRHAEPAWSARDAPGLRQRGRPAGAQLPPRSGRSAR